MAYTTVSATLVGVIAAPAGGKYVFRPCDRCGRRRQVNRARPSSMCADCKAVDPTFGQPRGRTA